jgi:hypothetical protein
MRVSKICGLGLLVGLIIICWVVVKGDKGQRVLGNLPPDFIVGKTTFEEIIESRGEPDYITVISGGETAKRKWNQKIVYQSTRYLINYNGVLIGIE